MLLGPDRPAGLAGTRGAIPEAQWKSTICGEFGANSRTIGLMLYAAGAVPGVLVKVPAAFSSGRLQLSDEVRDVREHIPGCFCA